MMRCRWFWPSLSAIACLAALPVQAKGTKAVADSVDQATLNAVTERGRYLAEAQRLRAKTAVEATLLKRTLQEGESVHYVVYKAADENWYTAFGALSRDRSSFFVEHAFMVPGERPNFMKEIEPGTLPLDAAPFARAAKTALERTASEMYARIKRLPREPIVLKVDDGYVAYVMPREDSLTSILLGADYKLMLAADGATVLSVQDLHAFSYPFELKNCPASGCLGAVHAHDSDSPPTETDVAMIIRNPGLSPHFVRCPKQVFEVEKSGAITQIAALKEGVARLVANPTGIQTANVKENTSVKVVPATNSK